jgi:hypothetical protein
MSHRPDSDRIAGGVEAMGRTRRAKTGEAMGVGRDCEPGRIEPRHPGARSRAFTDAQFHDKIMKACRPCVPIVCGAFYAIVQ